MEQKVMLKIKELRKFLNLTQKEFAEKIGIEAHNIGDWEREKCEPSIYWLIKISEVFSVSLEYLTGILESSIPIPKMKSDLNLNEKRLLIAFNNLEDIEQEKLIEDAEFYANRSSASVKLRNSNNQ